MQKKLCLSLLVALSGCLTAQNAFTHTLGFNKINCLVNSDTIVGIPFRAQGSQTAVLASEPVVIGDVATLTLSLNNLTAGAFLTSRHYVKFDGGTKDGRFYDITSNTANTLTINLNGDNLTGVIAGSYVVIAEYWTLNTLFPPTGATTSWAETPATSGNWVPNGHAVVSSNSNSSLARRTEILMPNLTTAGINLTPASIHFISGTTTKKWTQAKTGGTFVPSGDTVIYPDTYFTIRHSSSVSRPTILNGVGEVEMGSMSIPISTSATSKWDNQIALLRPIPLKLSELGLAGTSAFVPSGSVSSLARRDELFVYNNAVALKNRVPSTVYFVMGGNWQKMVNNVAVLANDDVIQAGYGIIIRKYKTSAGQTVFWENHATY